jgi:hypothetical protein
VGDVAKLLWHTIGTSLRPIRTALRKAPYQAIPDGCVSKARPVCMVVLTIVLGMIPLLKDPFFGTMSVCIMFGLAFAAVLSLIVTPVLYAIFFNVRETTPGGKLAATSPAQVAATEAPVAPAAPARGDERPPSGDGSFKK